MELILDKNKDKNKFVLRCSYPEFVKNKDVIKGNLYWNNEERYWWTREVTKVISLKNSILCPCSKEVENIVEKYLASYAVRPREYYTTRLKHLRQYQQAGVEFILNTNNTNVLLADPMGLGKTAQAIGAVCELAYMGEIKRILVISPAHLKNVWFQELEKFAYVPMAVTIFNGKKTTQYTVPSTLIGENPIAEMYIVNYDILFRHLVEFEKMNFDLIIFDESHYLKNKTAQRTKCALKLSSIIPIKIFLSGTPITKSPIDLFPVLQMLNHPLVENWFYYVKRYCNATKVKFKGREVWQYGSSNEKELAQILRSTCMIRRKKEDVITELPSKNRQIILLDSEEVADLVTAEKEILTAYQITPEEIMSSDSEVKIPKVSSLSDIRQKLALSKISAITALVDDILQEQEKVVIFAHHHSVIHALHAVISKSYATSVITGETSQEERDLVIHQFQNKKDPRVLIASIIACGTGVTLTKAHTAIFVELDWIPANIEQAEDRIHRISQTADSCMIYYVVIQNTLESYIAKKMLKRLQNIQKVLL